MPSPLGLWTRKSRDVTASAGQCLRALSADFIGYLIPPGSQRASCSYSLVDLTANKTSEISAHFGLQPIATQNFNQLAGVSIAPKER